MQVTPKKNRLGLVIPAASPYLNPCGAQSACKIVLDRFFGNVNYSRNGELPAANWHAGC